MSTTYGNCHLTYIKPQSLIDIVYKSGYEPSSAGTRPISDINLLAIEAMREVGIDISNQRSKMLTEDMIKRSTIRVNMGCVENSTEYQLYDYHWSTSFVVRVLC